MRENNEKRVPGASLVSEHQIFLFLLRMYFIKYSVRSSGIYLKDYMMIYSAMEKRKKKLLCSLNSDTGRANLLILLNKLRTERLNASEQMEGRLDKKLFIHYRFKGYLKDI